MITMSRLRDFVFLCALVCSSLDAARILAVFPTPSISHQVPFRPLTQELARRGHQVVVITPDPAFPKGHTPENLTEIDVHDISYEIWRNVMSKIDRGIVDDSSSPEEMFSKALRNIFEQQTSVFEVKDIIKNQNHTFDLLFVEAWFRQALGFSHVIKAPVIAVSSLGAIFDNYHVIGAPTHPILYPDSINSRFYNLSLWEKVGVYVTSFSLQNIHKNAEAKENTVARRIFGEDTPPLSELQNNIDMLFLNIHPIWEGNRPVPPSVIHIGGIHQSPEKELPQDLKQYLDSSEHGVIYLSFGTNVDTSMLPPEKVQAIINVLSQLPYDVLWKWNQDELPGRTKNIRISKWFPQSDLLKHPKIKLFITQGGLQSTDETLIAGVPVVGIPMIGDQWYNVEKYVHHRIGKQINLPDLDEETLKSAIKTVIEDKTYRENVVRLRSLMADQPMSPLERAVWWTEHVLRHGGRHLRAPAANMSWREYYELDLVLIILSIVTAAIVIVSLVLYKTVRFILSLRNVKAKQSKLSTSCEFGTLCDSLIKDRLICGIASKAIRERLLREADLTLEQAMEICRAAIVSKVYSEKIVEDSREKSIIMYGKYHKEEVTVVAVDGSRGREAAAAPPLGAARELGAGAVGARRTRPCRRERRLARAGAPLVLGIGCLPGSYKIRVNRECKPVVHAPRKVPIPLREKLKAKLEDMERQDIIAKVEGPTDWVNSMTIVKKPNGDLRICLDPKELNQAIKREHFRLPTLDEIVSNLSGAQYFSTLDATNGFWQLVYKPGKQLHIADALSRAYEPPAASSSDHHDLQDELTEAVHTVCAYNELTDTHYLILQKETDSDSEMQLLRKYIRKGWPEEKKDVEDVVKPIYNSAVIYQTTIMTMVRLRVFLCFCTLVCSSVNAARILAVFPVPSISHQVTFRPLTQELARRGHEVVVITPDPAFPKGQAPENLTEIDVHDVSYGTWRQLMTNVNNGKQNDFSSQYEAFGEAVRTIFEQQMTVLEVQNIIKNQNDTFDLLIVEACVRHALGFSYVIKVPVIAVSSFGAVFDNYDVIGAPSHPMLYPDVMNSRIYNLSFWEKINLYYNTFTILNLHKSAETKDNVVVRRIFGKDTPALSELQNNIDMLFLNIHPIWEGNHPVPPGVVHIGGIHQNPEKNLPQDLQQYLDSSKHGVIYLSFGSNVDTSMLPPEKVQTIINVFSQLPYDVLWKWNQDELPGRTKNIRISKWFPQSDLLRHPKIKLFITQGGLQSTDETIIAGVPVVGIPMFGDQWYNVEKYVHHGIGKQINLPDLDEEILKSAIKTVIEDKTYRENVVRLRSLMADQPMSPLERAVWWTEHVLRHGGRHLRAPAANMDWREYYELDLILVVLSTATTAIVAVSLLLYKTIRVILASSNVKAKRL
ncbi:uncharacterized protein LOC133521750 [Cydia pomonella]|uniref:uncharacterized protein LOC133521750 n=1 Tax=Cydia pomonella TaxID=82600 RepID=UPI002ADD66F1|nr:uncharacterized protein LOC133521750 [Cydia pomonella]